MLISEADAELVNEYAENIDMQDIGLFWQLTLKTIDDLRIVGNENLTLEMYIMQLAHLKGIDKKKEIISESEISFKNKENITSKKIEKNLDSDLSNQIKNQLKNTDQIKQVQLKLE